jgi:hypothetical protein
MFAYPESLLPVKSLVDWPYLDLTAQIRTSSRGDRASSSHFNRIRNLTADFYSCCGDRDSVGYELLFGSMEPAVSGEC